MRLPEEGLLRCRPPELPDEKEPGQVQRRALGPRAGLLQGCRAPLFLRGPGHRDAPSLQGEQSWELVHLVVRKWVLYLVVPNFGCGSCQVGVELAVQDAFLSVSVTALTVV